MQSGMQELSIDRETRALNSILAGSVHNLVASVENSCTVATQATIAAVCLPLYTS